MDENVALTVTREELDDLIHGLGWMLDQTMDWPETIALRDRLEAIRDGLPKAQTGATA